MTAANVNDNVDVGERTHAQGDNVEFTIFSAIYLV